MQISGLRDTQFLTQPRSMMSQGMEGQKLVFLYPMMFYDTLPKNLQDLLREFFSVNFLSQIKESNMINITTDAIRGISGIRGSSNSVNPAELVRTSLWHNSPISMASNNQLDSWTANEYRHIYQERIREFYEFIKNQIEHDPRYKTLKPVVSNITSENLLQIPIVIGTKSYAIHPLVLYYILLVSLAFEIPIKNSNNINAIFNIIERISYENYINIISDNTYKNNLLRDIGITRDTSDPTSIETPGRSTLDIRRQSNQAARSIFNNRVFGRLVYNLNNQERRRFSSLLNTELAKAKIFFELVLNPSRWTIESNGLETRNGLTVNTIAINNVISSKYYSSAINSFSSYLRSSIVPLFHSIEIVTGPTPSTISVSNKIDGFFDDIIKGMENEFTELGNSIIHFIRNQNTVDTSVMKSNIKSVTEICVENSKMTDDIRKTLNDLDDTAILSHNFNASSLSSFIKQIVLTSRTLKSHEKVIDQWFDLMTVYNSSTNTRNNTQLNTLILNIKSRIQGLVHSLFFNEYPENTTGNSPWIDYRQPVYERFTNFAYNVCEKKPKLIPGVAAAAGAAAQFVKNVFTGDYEWEPPDIRPGAPNLIANQQSHNLCMNTFKHYMSEMEIAIQNIIMFLLKWNFFSYICDYIKEVDVDIEVQRRDALEFPNYCLVLPMELFKGLHNALTINHLNNILRDTNGVVDNINELNFTTSLSDIPKMVNYICTRINIPNIIIYEKSSQKIFYKFMYMHKPINLTTSSLEQYVSHQKDILIL